MKIVTMRMTVAVMLLQRTRSTHGKAVRVMWLFEYLSVFKRIFEPKISIFRVFAI